MTRIRNISVVGIASLSALAFAAAPALAATTTVRAGSAGGAPYSGNVQANLLGNATVSSSLGSGTCNESQMTGSVNSDGSNLTINAASFSSNGGGPCTGSTSSTVTAQQLPWTGGTVVHNPVAGGKDGDITIANFRVRAVVNVFGGITCNYGGNLTAAAFNGDNPNRPNTSVAEAQAAVTNATVTKINSGSSFFCPGTATVTATYKLNGETTAGSGVFDQSLYITS